MSNKRYLTTILLAAVFCLFVQPIKAQDVYTKLDSITIERMLDGARKQPRDINLPIYFARQFLGRPYVAHTLEVTPQEQLIVNTRQFDCTTLVETTTALTLCARRQQYTFKDYADMLRLLRYHDDVQKTYASRLHYFSDWIITNSGRSLVREIQFPETFFSATQTLLVNYMSNHSSAYKALVAQPVLIHDIVKQEKQLTGQTFKYIPAKKITNNEELRQIIHDGDIIAITTSKKGLDIAHLGFAVWRNNGLHLLNASQVHKKVVEESMTLRQYLSKHPSFTGIRIIRINR